MTHPVPHTNSDSLSYYCHLFVQCLFFVLAFYYLYTRRISKFGNGDNNTKVDRCIFECLSEQLQQDKTYNSGILQLSFI